LKRNFTSPPVVLGVDAGGTKIMTAYVDKSGTIYESKRYPMNRSAQPDAVNSIKNAVTDFIECYGGERLPQAVGLGTIGHIDTEKGIWLHAINIPINSPVPIAEELSTICHVPAAVDNDVHAAALAELKWGFGPTCANIIYINVGTGIAAGIISENRLIRGASNYAGELGHMIIDPEGEPCACGQRGCLEAVASGGGIISAANSGLNAYPGSVLNNLKSEGKLHAGTVFQAAEAGDEFAGKIAGRALIALGTAIVNLVNLLNPEMVVLGGGMLREKWIAGYLHEYTCSRALAPAKKALKGIEVSALNPEHVGVLGAACLAWNRL